MGLFTTIKAPGFECNEDSRSLIPLATNKVKSIHRRADHKSGLNLKARRFRVEIQTPEANVQHG